MQRNYSKLRERMRKKGFTAEGMTEKINRHFKEKHAPYYISSLMCGRAEWRLPVIYFMAKCLEIPRSELWIYWPEGGVDIDEKEVAASKTTQAEKIVQAILDALGSIA